MLESVVKKNLCATRNVLSKNKKRLNEKKKVIVHLKTGWHRTKKQITWTWTTFGMHDLFILFFGLIMKKKFHENVESYNFKLP